MTLLLTLLTLLLLSDCQHQNGRSSRPFAEIRWRLRRWACRQYNYWFLPLLLPWPAPREHCTLSISAIFRPMLLPPKCLLKFLHGCHRWYGQFDRRRGWFAGDRGFAGILAIRCYQLMLRGLLTVLVYFMPGGIIMPFKRVIEK